MDFAASEYLTLSLQGSYNDSTVQEDFWRTPQEKEDGEPPAALAGTEMPYVPKLQLTGIGRLNFNMGDLPSFAQVAVSYRDPWSDLDRLTIGGKWMPIPCSTVCRFRTG
jgi:hypothetical protein